LAADMAIQTGINDASVSAHTTSSSNNMNDRKRPRAEDPVERLSNRMRARLSW
jgi:hypothetical protein